MINSTYCKCHQHAMSIRSGNQAHKIGRNTKVHVTVDAFGMPI